MCAAQTPAASRLIRGAEHASASQPVKALLFPSLPLAAAAPSHSFAREQIEGSNTPHLNVMPPTQALSGIYPWRNLCKSKARIKENKRLHKKKKCNCQCSGAHSEILLADIAGCSTLNGIQTCKPASACVACSNPPPQKKSQINAVFSWLPKSFAHGRICAVVQPGGYGEHV